ncbi:AAA family ATPase [uncultured Algimonas sp.]|uniref:AAA family ATPase n=1 Tax=uncultured Algimonas sp. TaxID=1547920 RepID=UPI0026199686|nr:AAA family ATPase [uncultured Algimonas sp.]
MKLDAFRFRHVGPFGADGIAVSGLQPGLNVVAEHNERGKSSLLTALETVLFLPHTSWRGDAKRLQRDGGTPVGEVDFTHAGRAYRLKKSFVKSRDAQLADRETGAVIATKREAEEKLADMLGLGPARARGPSGLLWVRQGDSMARAEDDGQVASKLETELSTLVGGERARAYLDRTETDLGELLTPTGRVRTGGPLALAEDALAATEAALEAARTAKAATHRMSLDLSRVRERIAATRAQGDPEAEADELAEAQAALDRAKVARSELDRKREKLARLEAERERAAEKLAAHMSAVQALDEAQAEIAALEVQRAGLAERRAGVARTLDQLDETLIGYERDRDTLAALDSRRAARGRLADRNAALQAITANLEALDGELDRRAGLVAERDVLPSVTRDVVDEMDRRSRDVQQADVALAGMDAVLLLTLESGHKARLDGHPVGTGQVRLDASRTLTIDGVGTIRLDAPEAETLRRQRDEAETALSDIQDEYSVESQEEALRILRDRKALSDNIAVIDRQITLIAPDGRDALLDARERLHADIERLRIQLEDEPRDETPIDADALRDRLSQTRGERNAARSQLTEIDLELARTGERLSARRRALAAAPLTAASDRRGAAYGTLAAQAATLASQIDTAEAALSQAEAQAPTDPALIEARIKRLGDIARTRTETLSQLRMEEAELSARRRESFEQRDPDAEVARLEARAARLHEDLERHRRRADALSLLRDTLRESQATLQERYTDPVRQELQPLLRMVIDGADVSLDETLGAQGLIRDGRQDDLEQLSGGTREQIAILTRFAYARMLGRQGQPSPVILDDALVYADDQRRARMFDVMHYVTSGSDPLQLLYLSCHEANAVQLGGHRLTMRPWPEN